MTDDDVAFEYTLTATRGSGTDDRDKHRIKVSADTIDELAEKVEEAEQLLEEKAADVRRIQPGDGHGRPIDEDQATLGEGDA
jgi:hypothetical protein